MSILALAVSLFRSFIKWKIFTDLVEQTKAKGREGGEKNIVNGDHPWIIDIRSTETAKKSEPEVNQGKCEVLVEEIIEKTTHSEV